MLRAGEEVRHRLVLNRDGRILEAEKVFDGRLQMAREQTADVDLGNSWPSGRPPKQQPCGSLAASKF